MEELAPDIEAVIDRMAAAGVARAIVVGCDEMSSREAIDAARRYSNDRVKLYATVGVHPHDASSAEAGLPEELTDLAANSLCAAVGEIGLDFYYDNSPRDVQRRVFAEQIEWAREARKPIVLHLRNAKSGGDAYGEAMKTLRAHHADEIGGVVHCFSGTVDDARSALDLGFFVSFAGPVTYPKATELREAAKLVPLDRILCETDSPYLAPQSRRGKRNEPALVAEVYDMVARVKGISVEMLADAVWRNCGAAFDLAL